MTPPEEKKEWWHYLAVKKLSTLSRRRTSIHYRDFYCLNCLQSFKTENKLKSHKKVRKKRFLWNCNAIRKRWSIYGFR